MTRRTAPEIRLPDFESRLLVLLHEERARAAAESRTAPRRARPHLRRRLALAAVAGVAIAATAALTLPGGSSTDVDGTIGRAVGGAAAVVGAAPEPASAAEVRARVAAAIDASKLVIHQIQLEPREDGGSYRTDTWYDGADGNVIRWVIRDESGHPAVDTSMKLDPDAGTWEILTWDIVGGTARRQTSTADDSTSRPTYADEIRTDLDAGRLHLLETTKLDGRKTYLLADDEPLMERRYWIDAETYLPVRITAGQDASIYDTTVEWLPRSEANLRALRTRPPADVTVEVVDSTDPPLKTPVGATDESTTAATA